MQTPKGLRLLSVGRATVGFFKFWSDHHALMASNGYTIKLDSDGHWWVKKWQRVEDLKPFDYTTTLPDYVVANLLPWQPQPTIDLMGIIQRRQFAFDASEAGTGKTAHTCAAAAALRRPLVILCAKYAKPQWIWMAKRFRIDPTAISHWELVREGKTDMGSWIERKVELKTKTKTVPFFRWNPDYRKAGAILAIDEIHNSGGIGTKNSEIAITTKLCGLSTIGISATAADTPTRMKALAYLLGLIKNPDHFYAWAYRHGCVQNGYRSLVFGNDNDPNVKEERRKVMAKLHSQIFDSGMAIRMLKKDIPGFPTVQVSVEAIDCGNAANKINREYGTIREVMEKLACRNINRNDAKKLITHSRRQIELLKVPTTVDMVRDDISEGRSEVLFVNYRETCIQMGKLLNVPIIIGAQAENERLGVMRDFQEDRHRAVPSTYGAGSESINLQDERGQYPRSGILYPPYRAQFIVQAMNRIHRATAKSGAIVRFVYAWNTIEEETMDKLRGKIERMDMLNDGEAYPLPDAVLNEN